MKIKNENGIKWISCDNLGELVEEFKKFRASEMKTGAEKNYEDYFFLQGARYGITELPDGNIIPNDYVDSVGVYQKDGVDLSLNLKTLNLTERDWSPYRQKVKKILREIWETGEVKDYQGLDLNWPASQQDNNPPPSNFDKDKIKDLEGENKELREKLKKETDNKTIWMAISIVAVSVFSLVLLFCWLKIKKLKKR